MSKLISINPYNQEELEVYDETSPQKIQKAFNLSQKAFENWSKISLDQKKEVFLKVAALLEKNKDAYARLASLEMGKVITESLAEVEKCAQVCRYYVENIDSFLERKRLDPQTFISFQALGCILAVMPWNFPFWQVFRFACPVLLGGNVALLKHASNVSGCSLLIENLLLEAGLPQGVFQSLLLKSDKVKSLIENSWVKGVSLTGSEEAGRKVAATAGKNLKKSLLELGGSDPYLIYPDADIEQAARLCVQSRLLNAGQSCIGAKRFLIHEKVYEDFKSVFTHECQQIKYGDPLDQNSQMGPLAKREFKKTLDLQVKKTLEKGASLGFKGGLNDDGFYPITILENIPREAPAYSEELFGPVASFYKVSHMKEAIQIANDSSFGLGAGIFSQDAEQAFKVAEKEIHAGSCFINDFVKSYPQAPFGGIKNSGYGRELSSYGVYEFLNIKTIKKA